MKKIIIISFTVLIVFVLSSCSNRKNENINMDNKNQKVILQKENNLIENDSVNNLNNNINKDIEVPPDVKTATTDSYHKHKEFDDILLESSLKAAYEYYLEKYTEMNPVEQISFFDNIIIEIGNRYTRYNKVLSNIVLNDGNAPYYYGEEELAFGDIYTNQEKLLNISLLSDETKNVIKEIESDIFFSLYLMYEMDNEKIEISGFEAALTYDIAKNLEKASIVIGYNAEMPFEYISYVLKEEQKVFEQKDDKPSTILANIGEHMNIIPYFEGTKILYEVSYFE